MSITYVGSPYHPSRQISQWKPVVACSQFIHSPVSALHVEACPLHSPNYEQTQNDKNTLKYGISLTKLSVKENITNLLENIKYLTWFTIRKIPVAWFAFVTSSTIRIFVTFTLTGHDITIIIRGSSTIAITGYIS